MKNNEVVVDIACGALHTLALTNNSKVYSCGFGGNYSLGHNSNRTFYEFKEIAYFQKLSSKASHKINKICCGTSHSGALINGKLYIWGLFANSKYSQNKIPIAVNMKNPIADFVMGDLLTVILSKNGEVFTLGENNDYQLGVSKVSNYEAVKVPLPCKIEYICCGLNHVIAINNSKGRIYGWGSNKFGQIHPASSEKVLREITDLKWIDKSKPFIITCGPLNTLLVSAKKAVIPKHGKVNEDINSILALKNQIESMKRKALKMNQENVKLKDEILNLHNNLNSHMDSHPGSSGGGNNSGEHDSDSKLIIRL